MYVVHVCILCMYSMHVVHVCDPCMYSIVCVRIASSLDGNLASLIEQGRLVWMPAHQTAAHMARSVKSTGQPVTVVDWRANRLADALAKSAATETQAPPAALKLLDAAAAAVKHCATLLGQVTHAANHNVPQTVFTL